MSTPTNVPTDAASPSTGLDPADPLAAFLEGLHGLSRLDGGGVPSSLPAGAAGPPATVLANGLNADAAVAQLVSALAGVPDGHSAFAATPFAAPSDTSGQGIVAPATE